MLSIAEHKIHTADKETHQVDFKMEKFLCDIYKNNQYSRVRNIVFVFWFKYKQSNFLQHGISVNTETKLLKLV